MKDITFHINNLAYTIKADEILEAELCKFLDPKNNNDLKQLLIAYLHLHQEFRAFKNDVEDITKKLEGF